MEKVVLDTAIKFGAGRYRQERGLLKECGGEVARFGRRVLIVTGPRSWMAVEEQLTRSLADAGVEFKVEFYEGWCTYEGARALSDKAKAYGAEEVVGVGGGKLVDIAKAVAEYAGIGVVEIPTSASTCAPFTCMSVMYTLEGAKQDCWRYEHELDGVYVDLDIIAACPIRYNAAGILDAMAKKIEILNGKFELNLSETPIDLFTAFNFASYCYDILEENGQTAIEDNRRQTCTKLIEDVTFINIAVTGVIANITKSFRQSALAHVFYDGVRTLFPQEASGAIHGEIVAVGLFCQLYYNGLPSKEEELRTYMRSMDLPLTLGEIGVEPTEENLAKIEEYLWDSHYVEHDDAHRALLRRSIREMI